MLNISLVTWGVTIAEGQGLAVSGLPHLLVFPGLALVLTVSPEIGIVLFVLGAVGSVVVTLAMLRPLLTQCCAKTLRLPSRVKMIV